MDDAAAEAPEGEASRTARRNDSVLVTLLALVVMLAGAALAWLALFANEVRSADFDPQFVRLIAERTQRFGGTYYENSLHNKGPLDMFLYSVPRHLLGFDAYWYGISFMVLMGTALLAFAVSRTTQLHDVPRAAGVAMGFVAFFHFALAKADYSGVLYTRNETAYLLAAVWLLIIVPACWSERWSLRSVAAIGVLMGLAAQTLVSSVVECAVLAGLALWMLRERIDAPRRRRHLVVGVAAGFLTFIAAPVWYLLRGSFDEFWAGWWTYARFQSDATDLTVVDKFQRGWDAMTKYYGDYPLSLVIVVAFVGLTWLFWQRLSRVQRAVHVAAFAWLLSGWLELVISWRYSSHYFAVVAVPTMFIAALLVGHGLTLVAKVRPLRLAPLFPLLALVGCLVYFSDNRVRAGFESIRHYHSPEELIALRNANSPGNVRAVRALLDVVSADDDALLAWTNSPTPYLQFRRVPASRMFWSNMLIGKIYLGKSGPEWVLPQTWDWFAQDMRETEPAAEWETKAAPHDQDTPFAEYVDGEMTELYDGSLDTVSVRDDISALLAAPGEAFADLDVNPTPSENEVVDLGAGYCRAVEMDVHGDTDIGLVTFAFGGTPFSSPTLSVADTGVSGKDDGTVFDTATLPEPATDGTRTLRVVVGRQSAVLMVDGVVAGAVELKAQHPTLTMTGDQDGVRITGVRAGDVTWPAGC